MPKAPKSAEGQMIKACDFARTQKKPNISKIARKFGISRRSLHNRVKKGV
jgi:transcriptional regulator of acetoin/glycerol metabolism